MVAIRILPGGGRRIKAVNEEVRDLFAAGADVVQLDEPYMQARYKKAEEYGIEVLDRAAINVADAMQFTPARNQDQPVKVWVELPMVFKTK